jgi:hypothetical protein
MEVILSFWIGFWISIPITLIILSPLLLLRNRYPKLFDKLFERDWNILGTTLVIIWVSNSLEGLGIGFNLRILKLIGSLFRFLLEQVGFFN